MKDVKLEKEVEQDAANGHSAGQEEKQSQDKVRGLLTCFSCRLRDSKRLNERVRQEVDELHKDSMHYRDWEFATAMARSGVSNGG